MKAASYLFAAQAFVCVVELVGEDLPVARERRVPAQGDGRGRVGHRLQVGRRAGHLDCEQNRAGQPS